MVGFFELNSVTLAKAFDFKTVSSRREYWNFILFTWMVLLGALVADYFIAGDMIYNIMTILLFVPYLAVSVRRMHDTNHRGWWILMPIVSLILLLSPTINNRWSNKAE